jgi:phosphohistidine phosphatase
MITRLILMRHAKSSWKYPELSDHERPLNKRGRKAAGKIAKELIRLES